jgi:RNA polymerase-binding protein DksA
MRMAPAPAKKATGSKAVAAKSPAKAAVRATPAKSVRKVAPVKAASAKAAPAKAAPAKAAPRKAAPAKAAPAKAAPAKAAAPARTKVPATKAAPVGKKAPATKAPAKRTARKRTVICPLSGFEVMPGGPALSPRTKARLKDKLLGEKTRLLHQADELVAEAEELAREREAGDTQFDEESGEGDTIAVERERDLLLSAQARHVVDEIDAALARMKKGTYGVCSYAGRKIPLERLEAIPWADVCVDCKARAERRR